MKKDDKLRRYIGKEVLIVDSKHPYFKRSGKGVAFDQLATEDWGLRIDFGDDFGAYVYSSLQIKPLIDDDEDSVPSYQKDLSECNLEETIERLSAVNYSFKEMAIYVGMDPQEFKKEATNEDSKIWLAIQRGKLQAQFEINDKLAANARSGNITAAQIYAKNCEMKDVENLKQRIFYGE